MLQSVAYRFCKLVKSYNPILSLTQWLYSKCWNYLRPISKIKPLKSSFYLIVNIFPWSWIPCSYLLDLPGTKIFHLPDEIGELVYIFEIIGNVLHLSCAHYPRDQVVLQQCSSKEAVICFESMAFAGSVESTQDQYHVLAKIPSLKLKALKFVSKTRFVQ